MDTLIEMFIQARFRSKSSKSNGYWRWSLRRHAYGIQTKWVQERLPEIYVKLLLGCIVMYFCWVHLCHLNNTFNHHINLVAWGCYYQPRQLLVCHLDITFSHHTNLGFGFLWNPDKSTKYRWRVHLDWCYLTWSTVGTFSSDAPLLEKDSKNASWKHWRIKSSTNRNTVLGYEVPSCNFVVVHSLRLGCFFVFFRPL